MPNEFIPIPNQVTTEAKMNEIMKMQQQNNLLLLSQSPNVGEQIKETAQTDELALLSEVTLVSDKLRSIAVTDWYSIKKSVEIHNANEEEKNLGR